MNSPSLLDEYRMPSLLLKSTTHLLTLKWLTWFLCHSVNLSDQKRTFNSSYTDVCTCISATHIIFFTLTLYGLSTSLAEAKFPNFFFSKLYAFTSSQGHCSNKCLSYLLHYHISFYWKFPIYKPYILKILKTPFPFKQPSSFSPSRSKISILFWTLHVIIFCSFKHYRLLPYVSLLCKNRYEFQRWVLRTHLWSYQQNLIRVINFLLLKHSTDFHNFTFKLFYSFFFDFSFSV